LTCPFVSHNLTNQPASPVYGHQSFSLLLRSFLSCKKNYPEENINGIFLLINFKTHRSASHPPYISYTFASDVKRTGPDRCTGSNSQTSSQHRALQAPRHRLFFLRQRNYLTCRPPIINFQSGNPAHPLRLSHSVVSRSLGRLALPSLPVLRRSSHSLSTRPNRQKIQIHLPGQVGHLTTHHAPRTGDRTASHPQPRQSSKVPDFP